MTPEDDPQLWNLLGKSRTPEVSSFFSRNVLREIRQQKPRRFSDRARRWILGGALVPMSGVAAILLLGVMEKRPSTVAPTPTTETPIEVVAQNDGADDELLMDLDDVVSGDENAPAVDQSIL
jgi:hypothetical protein